MRLDALQTTQNQTGLSCSTALLLQSGQSLQGPASGSGCGEEPSHSQQAGAIVGLECLGEPFLGHRTPVSLAKGPALFGHRSQQPKRLLVSADSSCGSLALKMGDLEQTIGPEQELLEGGVGLEPALFAEGFLGRTQQLDGLAVPRQVEGGRDGTVCRVGLADLHKDRQNSRQGKPAEPRHGTVPFPASGNEKLEDDSPAPA